MALDSDRLFLREALPDLRDYILSPDLYWPLKTRSAGGIHLPQLTIGNLLLSQVRLAALERTSQPDDDLATITRQINEIRQDWRANWGLKAGREFVSRLNLWQQFLQELRPDPQRSVPVYATEVRMRAILHLLLPEGIDLPADQQEQLQMSDHILKGLTRPGPFVWEADLASGFPQADFWFLFVTFPGKEK